MNKFTKRRYKAGEHEEYDSHYNRAKVNSTILNSGSEKVPSINTIFFDEVTLKNILYRLVGDEEGLIRNGSTKVQAEIPYIETQLKSNENQFKAYQKQQELLGRGKPKVYPPELLKKKLSTEARLDILCEEAEFITSKLKEIEINKRKEQLKLMLIKGPRGIGRSGQCLEDKELRGVLIEIDGQTVSYINKRLIINEPTSPYHKIEVSAYINQIVKPWCNAIGRINKEKRMLYRELYFKGVSDGLAGDEIRSIAWDAKYKELLVENPGWKKLFGLRLKGKPDMPIIPESIAKNINEEVEGGTV